jgi:Cys-rich radical ribosomally synthesized peptide
MLTYSGDVYSDLFGNIEHWDIPSISQCTGCKCACKCSCSGGFVSDIEWEVL